MATLVNFLMINSTRSLGNLFEYTESIINELQVKGLISHAIVDTVTLEYGDGIEVEDTVFITDFDYSKEKQKSHWQIEFEFGTFTSSSQLQIKLSSEDYELHIEDNYLEQLKLSIKNIIKSDWEKTVWLMDKDSELLSIALYPSIYRIENLARRLISEIMTKEYGIGWWDIYVPLSIRNKHKARLSGYKSIAPGFANVDERLMSVDIGDLNSIFTLKEKKWNPAFDTEISSFLSDQTDIKLGRIKNILSSQMVVTFDLWKTQFEKYLSEDFIENFKLFELNRNHVVHNKLIDRAAYNSIANSISAVERELIMALQTLEKVIISKEQRQVIEQQMEREQQDAAEALQEIMESETGVKIRNSNEIIDMYNECLYQFHSEFQESLRFRNDLEIGDYSDISFENSTGKLFEIRYKINNEIANVNYSIESIDESQGAESILEISIEADNKRSSHLVTYMNGEVSFNSYQGCYMPETQDGISATDLEELTDEFMEFLQAYFGNNRENIDSQMYSIIKDGGSSPVADIPCWECGEDYICVDENYGAFGQCLNCGEMNDICLCDRCGSYFEGEPNDDEPNFCENCLDYFEKE